jgi:hypothetical protein
MDNNRPVKVTEAHGKSQSAAREKEYYEEQ